MCGLYHIIRKSPEKLSVHFRAVLCRSECGYGSCIYLPRRNPATNRIWLFLTIHHRSIPRTDGVISYEGLVKRVRPRRAPAISAFTSRNGPAQKKNDGLSGRKRCDAVKRFCRPRRQVKCSCTRPLPHWQAHGATAARQAFPGGSAYVQAPKDARTLCASP